MDDYAILISVVVPIYKVEKYIKECVESILAQSYRHFELILVDDGSPDGCGEICDQYKRNDERITVIHKKNGGLSDARNAGIDIAKGEYITFIDSDDYISKFYLEKLLKTALRYDADIVQAELVSKKESLGQDSGKKEAVYKTKYDIMHHYFVPHDIKDMACGKLYKTELFLDIRYPIGKINEDFRTTYKLLWDSFCVVCINTMLYYYRINPSGIMHGKLSAAHFEMLDVPDEIEKYLGEHATDFLYDLAYFRMRTDIAVYNMCLSSGQQEEFHEEMNELYKSLTGKHNYEKKWDIKYRGLIQILRISPNLYKTVYLLFHR